LQEEDICKYISLDKTVQCIISLNLSDKSDDSEVSDMESEDPGDNDKPLALPVFCEISM
jgi:hypothetical protein